MKHHVVVYAQNHFLFKPFENGETLAAAILENLTTIADRTSRLTIFTAPDTDGDCAALLSRFPALHADRRTEPVMHKHSMDFPEQILRLLEVSSDPLLILCPGSSFLDPEIVRIADEYFTSSKLLVLLSVPLWGWDMYLISPDRDRVADLFRQEKVAMSEHIHPLTALKRVSPEKSNTVIPHYLSVKRLPGFSADDVEELNLEAGSHAWEMVRALRPTVGLPLSQWTPHTVHSAYREHRLELIRHPKQIQIEWTTRSSVVPIYSPLAHPNVPIVRRTPQMTADIWDAVVDRIAADVRPGTELIFNCTTGDPLEHPDAGSFLNRLVERFPPLSLSTAVFYTHGGGLTEAFSSIFLEWCKAWSAKKIGRKVPQIIIRMDAVSDPVYRTVKQGTPLQTIQHHIESFLAARKKVDPQYNMVTVALATTLLKQTQDHIDDFMNAWPSLASREKKFVAGRKGQSPSVDHARDLMDFRRRFYRENKPVEYTVIYGASHYAGQIPVSPVADYTPLKRTPCRRLRDTLMILCDGTVVQCDRVLNPAGTVTAGSILDTPDISGAWQSPALDRLRQSHQGGAFNTSPLCVGCADWFIPL